MLDRNGRVVVRCGAGHRPDAGHSVRDRAAPTTVFDAPERCALGRRIRRPSAGRGSIHSRRAEVQASLSLRRASRGSARDWPPGSGFRRASALRRASDPAAHSGVRQYVRRVEDVRAEAAFGMAEGWSPPFCKAGPRSRNARYGGTRKSWKIGALRSSASQSGQAAGHLSHWKRIRGILEFRRRQDIVVLAASSDQQRARVLASVKARRSAPPPLPRGLRP